MAPLGRSVDVDREVLGPLQAMADVIGVPVESLFEGVEHLVDPPPRFPWADMARVADNIGRHATSDAQMWDATKEVVRHKATGRIARAAGFFTDPGTFLIRAMPLHFRRYFPLLNIRCWRDGAHVEIEISIPPDLAGSQAFHVCNAGLFAAAPCVLGLPEAEVQMEVSPHRGRYRILPPPSRTLWRRLKTVIAVLRNTAQTMDELERSHRILAARHKDLEEALQARDTALGEKTQALETRDNFLRRMGHELRTPLNGLLAEARELDALDLDGLAGESAATVRHTADRLGRTIEQLLAYAKVAGGGATDQRTAAEPTALLHAIAQELSPIATRLDVTLVVESSDLGRWSFDPIAVHRILLELSKNAVHHSPKHTTVRLRAAALGDRLRFEIRDAGPGLPANTLDRLMEPFQQGPSHRDCEVRGGLGLGLPIAQGLAEAMGAELSLSSSPEGLEAAIELRAESLAAPPPRIAGRRVLVVDDDRLNRKVAERLLRRLDCEVETAEDGVEALERLAHGRFDLVLMDCEMPRLDGWATTQALRACGTEVPIVAATAYASDADRARCFEAGMDDFLSKPLDKALVQRVLDTYLGAPPSSSGSTG